jgi:hypothetical protein
LARLDSARALLSLSALLTLLLILLAVLLAMLALLLALLILLTVLALLAPLDRLRLLSTAKLCLALLALLLLPLWPYICYHLLGKLRRLLQVAADLLRRLINELRSRLVLYLLAVLLHIEQLLALNSDQRSKHCPVCITLRHELPQLFGLLRLLLAALQIVPLHRGAQPF